MLTVPIFARDFVCYTWCPPRYPVAFVYLADSEHHRVTRWKDSPLLTSDDPGNAWE